MSGNQHRGTLSGALLHPDDPWDRELLAAVHPADWVNPEPPARYDLVVLGGGSGGLVAAAAAAGLGARTALVERHLLGGDCLNAGCVPSKTLLRSARWSTEMARAAELGWATSLSAAAKPTGVLERVRRTRAAIAPHDAARRFRDELGVDVFLGEGHFAAADSIEVAGARLRYRRAIVATGAGPVWPQIEGLEQIEVHTNDSIFALDQVPARLAIIGGGPVGCELAQAFSRLGCRCFILQRNARLLPREEPEVSALIEAALRHDGIGIATSARLLRARPDPRGAVLEYEGGGEIHSVAADAVLLAAGRRPATAGLGLETAGIDVRADGSIATDARLRTTNRRVLAVGDVTLAQRFTHAADASARIAVRNALFFGRTRFQPDRIPRSTFTDPEVASVGLLPADAAQRGLPIETLEVRFADNDRAVTEGDRTGFVRAHVAPRTGRLVGASVVGEHAGELIGELAVILATGLRLGALADVVHPYPTRAEAIRRLGDLHNRSRLTPRVARFLRTLARLPRW